MTSTDPRRSGDFQERRRCHPRGMSVLSCPPIRSETSLSSAAGTDAGRRHRTLGRCHARSPARRHGSPVRHAAGRRRLARRYGSMSHRQHRDHAASRSDSPFALRQARHGQPHRVRRHWSGGRRPCRARTPRRLRRPGRPGRPGRHRHHHRDRNPPCAPNHQPVHRRNPQRRRCDRNRPCAPNHRSVRPRRRRCDRSRPRAPHHRSVRPRRPGCHHRDRSRPCAPNHRPGRPRRPGRPGRLSHGLRHCHRPDDRVRNPRRHAVTRCRLRPLSPTS
jgi:hypothetical protein